MHWSSRVQLLKRMLQSHLTWIPFHTTELRDHSRLHTKRLNNWSISNSWLMEICKIDYNFINGLCENIVSLHSHKNIKLKLLWLQKRKIVLETFSHFWEIFWVSHDQYCQSICTELNQSNEIVFSLNQCSKVRRCLLRISNFFLLYSKHIKNILVQTSFEIALSKY